MDFYEVIKNDHYEGSVESWESISYIILAKRGKIQRVCWLLRQIQTMYAFGPTENDYLKVGIWVI